MGRVRSELQMVLVDGVSLPAKKVRKALADVDAQAKKTKGTAAGFLAGERRSVAPGVGTVANGRVLLGGAAAYLGGRAIAGAYTDAAGFDRRLTYILNTAGETRAAMGKVKAEVNRIAQDTAAPVEKVVGGLELLVAAGRDLPDALAFLPSVVRTAQAAGAETTDLAATADAFGTAFKIAGKEMGAAFDTAFYLGKKGKFELKDQARYLPSILPMAAARGLSGIEGAAKIIAALQVIRQNTGTAEEAAASLTDVLGKLDSTETVNNFRKNFGIDLPKALQKARKEGKNTFDAFFDIVELAVKGDAEKIGKIFADKEARRGALAIWQYRQQARGLVADAKNAAGEVGRDIKTVTEDAQSSIDRLTNSWKQLSIALAQTGDAFGAGAALQSITRDLETLGRIVDKVKGGDVGGAVKAGAEFLGRNRGPQQLARDEAVDANMRLQAAWDDRMSTYDRQAELVRQWHDLEAKPGRTAADEAMMRALAAGADSLGRIIAQLDADMPTLFSRAAEKADALRRLLPAEPRGGIGGLPPDAASERAPASYSITNPPLPPRKPSAAERVTMAPGIDPAAVDQAAREAAQRAQQILDANRPVIRPILDMSGVGSPAAQMGRAVSAGVAGAHSDVGAGSAAR